MSELEHEKIVKELENKYLGKCLVLKDGTTSGEIIEVAVDYRKDAQHMNRVHDGSKTIYISEILCIAEEVPKMLEENKELKEKINNFNLEIDKWLEDSKAEMREYGDNHEKYWLCFYQLLRKIKNKLVDISDYAIIDREREEELLNKEDILAEFEKWLEEEIKRISRLINSKKGIKPYGEELHLLENSINSYSYAKEKLQNLKEGKKYGFMDKKSE